MLTDAYVSRDSRATVVKAGGCDGVFRTGQKTKEKKRVVLPRGKIEIIGKSR